MASEHHITDFDTDACFTIHDLNRDRLWDKSEIEGLYGLHHYKSRDASKTEALAQHVNEDEMLKRRIETVVQAVLKIYDKDLDGSISSQEFHEVGASALPSFPQFESLGHHYGEEAEFYIHHEEKYHSDPKDQTEQAYVHPEDLEHFAHHEKLEQEEQKREQEFTGEQATSKAGGLDGSDAKSISGSGPDQLTHTPVVLNDPHPLGAHLDDTPFINQAQLDQEQSASKESTSSTQTEPRETVWRARDPAARLRSLAEARKRARVLERQEF